MGRKLSVSVLILVVSLSLCLHNVSALFGSEKRKLKKLQEEEAARLLAEEAAAEESAAATTMVNIPFLDIEVEQNILCSFVVMTIISILLMLLMGKNSKVETCETSKIGNRPNTSGTLDVVLVGCGLPKRGMGWYHLTQLLDMKNVNVVGVVEPFFMNPNLCKSPPASWTEFVDQTSKAGVKFVSAVQELPVFSERDTLCLIAGRTSDNPKLFQHCLQHGAKCIYLEKPGAPTVTELEEMKKLAEIMGSRVYLGYNKNVTPYVKKALAVAESDKESKVTFVHNNSYKKEELPECFSRNSEGMLKNMAVHELALLVSFFGVTVDTLSKFTIDKKVSQKLTLGGFTDFSKVSFEVTTKSGKSVAVIADRCGGNVSYASVINSKTKKELGKFEFPDEATQKKVDALSKADPEMMPYFFVQSDDYLELKNRVVSACLNDVDAEGVATISVAIEALKLAEYGTAELKKQL